MINIRQLTNFDLGDAEEVTKTIEVDGSTINHTYKVITSEMLGSDSIFKFGYCTNDNKGLYYPIFLVTNGEEKEFKICQSTGIFEFQQEEWKNVNVSDEEYIATVYVSSVLVPADIPFCIDYCYSV